MGSRVYRGLIITCCIGVVASCSTDDSAPPAAVSFDIDRTPILDIADTSTIGELELLRPTGAVRLPNGNVVVADAYAATIRFFDANGTLVRRVGRRGNGPGEFRSPSWISRCGTDSVFVWDAFRQSITVIDTAGTIARRYTIDAQPDFLQCSNRAEFLLQLPPAATGIPSDKTPHYTGHIWIADRSGHRLRDLGEFPYGENRPLGKLTQVALSSKHVFVGTNDSAAVDLYSHSGQRTRTLRIQSPQRRPTARNYQAAIDAQVKQLRVESERHAWRKQLETVPMPDQMPPYRDIILDDLGWVWVVVSALGDASTMLVAMDTVGQTLGTATLSSELEVYEVGRDSVLGAYEDTAGVPHVALYRFSRSR